MVVAQPMETKKENVPLCQKMIVKHSVKDATSDVAQILRMNVKTLLMTIVKHSVKDVNLDVAQIRLWNVKQNQMIPVMIFVENTDVVKTVSQNQIQITNVVMNTVTVSIISIVNKQTTIYVVNIMKEDVAKEEDMDHVHLNAKKVIGDVVIQMELHQRNSPVILVVNSLLITVVNLKMLMLNQLNKVMMILVVGMLMQPGDYMDVAQMEKNS